MWEDGGAEGCTGQSRVRSQDVGQSGNPWSKGVGCLEWSASSDPAQVCDPLQECASTTGYKCVSLRHHLGASSVIDEGGQCRSAAVPFCLTKLAHNVVATRYQQQRSPWRARHWAESLHQPLSRGKNAVRGSAIRRDPRGRGVAEPSPPPGRSFLPVRRGTDGSAS